MELVWDICYAVLKDGSLDRVPIHTERLVGPATKKTDKTLFLVLIFYKRPRRSLCLLLLFYCLVCFDLFSHPVR